jgi:uncharacterized membrane protein YedE/YeeE
LIVSNKTNGEWNPYLAGALTGLLMIGSALVAGKFFGTSTTFVKSTGMIEQLLAPEHVASLDYFILEEPKIDWQWMFVVGIFIGAFVSARLSGSFRLQGVPEMWQQRFGTSVAKRGVVAFIGGFIAICGARLAGGCPSGQGLSGLIQLSASGFVAITCFFLGGMIIARLLYGGARS